MDAIPKPLSGEPPALFTWLHRTRSRCFVANLLTVGFYGAAYVIFRARPIGRMTGVALPGPGWSLVLTVATLGIYPGVMLSVLGFRLGSVLQTGLGFAVLAFNLASLITALFSWAALLLLSVVLWAQAVWMVVEAEQTVIVRQTAVTPSPA